MNQTFIFRGADGADIHVTGALAVQMSTKTPDIDRWRELTLVKTMYGWACAQIGRTRIDGECDRPEVIVAESDDELIEKLGQSRMAHAVYDRAGIRNVDWIP